MENDSGLEVFAAVFFIAGILVGTGICYASMNARRGRSCDQWTVKEYQLKVEPAKCFPQSNKEKDL